MKAHLTERNAKTFRPGPRNTIVYDDGVIGFGLRITQAGARAFVLDYLFEARKRRLTIGSWPDWSVAAAREQAKRYKREIDQGRDPLAQRDERRLAPTIKDLIERYLDEHGPRLSKDYARDQRNMLNTYVLSKWRDRKVIDIRPADVDALLAEIAKGRARPSKAKTKQKRLKPLAPSKPTPIQANRVGGIIRKMFNLAIRWEMRTDNPASGFIRNPESPRERFLDFEEIARLSQALADHPNRRGADVIRLLMLTGARRGEALNARWEQFDLNRTVWTKPAATTKQRRLHRAPISRAAVALLRTVRERAPEGCPWVFPGDVDGQPLIEIKRFWDDIREMADLPGVRVHDLRHTFASLLVSGGMSLPMIGKLLGHTQVQTTQRYAHLFDDPLREGLDQIGDILRPKLTLGAIETNS
jgi:integrase